MLETETGDISLLQNVEDLRIVVEEFSDLLDEDFRFWDREGYRLRLDETFLRYEDRELTRGTDNELRIVKSHLIKYAEKRGVRVEDSERAGPIELYKLIQERIGEGG
jgi:hypothetical protein